MNKSILSCALLLCTLISTQALAASQKQIVDLNKGWQFRIAPDSSMNHVEGVTPDVDQATLQRVGNWTVAEVPGCVQTDLLQNKIIPEPFYRENEKTLQWIGQED
jgi:beta-mannosidase